MYQSTPGIMLIRNTYIICKGFEFIGNKQTDKQTNMQTLSFMYQYYR